MANDIIYGLGSPIFETKTATPFMLFVEPMEFSIEGEPEEKESTKYKDGKIVTAGSFVSKETYTLTIGIEAITWQVIQFAYGLLAGVTASAPLPQLRFGTVDPTTYTIDDADITTEDVLATVVDGSPLIKTAAVGSPAAGQYKVDTTNNELLFNSALAGATVAYRVFETLTNVETIGVEAAYTAFNTFKFSGLGYHGDGFKVQIVVPSLSKVGIPTFNIADVTKFELSYKMIVSGSDYLPFKMYKVA